MVLFMEIYAEVCDMTCQEGSFKFYYLYLTLTFSEPDLLLHQPFQIPKLNLL